jgi:hypothetical protein
MTKTQPPKHGPDLRPTAKIDLDFPIAVSGIEVSHLIMRRPKVRDEMAYSKASGSQEDKVLFLMASLCEVPVDDLMELDASDFSKLETQYMAFKGARSEPKTSDEE